MPAGDRQRTWFPEMVEVLRAEWRAEMSSGDLIVLRDRLDNMLQHIRHARPITLAKALSVTTNMIHAEGRVCQDHDPPGLPQT
ncbi:MAG: hypothetical protein HY270_00975 [Deltaproteobacteria bacterium]|nr:hypothetical protein [Deltaproteobacteria bacterium]